MAFTSAQIVSIKKYLGFPQVFESNNPRLLGAIELLGNHTERAAYIVSLLTELDVVDAAVAAAGSTTTTQGALKKVDEVEFYDVSSSSSGSDYVGALKRGKMLCGRLSSAMGVPIISNYFGTQGYSDDSWGDASFQVGSFPLG